MSLYAFADAPISADFRNRMRLAMILSGKAMSSLITKLTVSEYEVFYFLIHFPQPANRLLQRRFRR